MMIESLDLSCQCGNEYLDPNGVQKAHRRRANLYCKIFSMRTNVSIITHVEYQML